MPRGGKTCGKSRVWPAGKKWLPGFTKEELQKKMVESIKKSKEEAAQKRAKQLEDDAHDAAARQSLKDKMAKWSQDRPFNAIGRPLEKEEVPEEYRSCKGVFYESYPYFVPVYLDQVELIVEKVSFSCLIN